MDTNKKLLDLIAEQKSITDKYEEIVNEITKNKELDDINKLKNEVTGLNKELKEIEKKYLKEVNDNLALKTSLREQILSEKTGIINASKAKIQTYFNDQESLNGNKLTDIELDGKNRIDKAIKVLNNELKEESYGLSLRLIEIEKELEDLIKEKKEALSKNKTNILLELKQEYEDLKNETIDEELIEKRKKQNDIEVKIGLNLINKIGIILLLLGVATGMKYTYSNWFGVYMKSILGFAIGISLLVLGEWFNRKEKTVFSLGMCGGGLGILYVAVFNSYFSLQSLSLPASLVLYLLITILSIILSTRYESQAISAISLIGGYIPLFNYMFFETPSVGSIYIAMVYLLILNSTILILSKDKRWTFVKYLSFFLNIPTSIYLMFNSNSDLLSLFYSFITFLMYLAIILRNPVQRSLELKLPEVILLGLNTVINALISYALFDVLAWSDFNGLLALIYAVTYFILGRFIGNKDYKSNKTSDLFYLTSLTFAILMVPFQFGAPWLAMGWLVESVLLIHLFKTKYKDEDKLELAGWTILGLSLLSFILIDFTLVNDKFFILKYTVTTGSLVYVLKLHLPSLKEFSIFSDKMKERLLYMYKYFVLIFTWIFLLRISFVMYKKFIGLDSDISYFFSDLFLPTIFALVTGLYAYLIANIKELQDKIVSGISIAMYVLVDIVGFLMIFLTFTNFENTGMRFLAIFILFVYHIFIFFNLKTLSLIIIKNFKLSLEVFPIVMAIYLTGIIPLFLINHFNLANMNFIVSIIFIVLSFIYIMYGFNKHFVLIRRFGLFLSMFSTAKLFVFDLMFLNTLGRIIAYLSFGITLIAISYIYQRLKTKTESTSPEEEI